MGEAWTVTRRPSEADILVERPGVTGPVVIVRVAPPFDEAAWDAAERAARRAALVLDERTDGDGRPLSCAVVLARRLDEERDRADTAEYLGDADQAEIRALLGELGAARAALGTAWLYGGASIAEGIRRKTATLERLWSEGVDHARFMAAGWRRLAARRRPLAVLLEAQLVVERDEARAEVDRLRAGLLRWAAEEERAGDPDSDVIQERIAAILASAETEEGFDQSDVDRVFGSSVTEGGGRG